MPDRARVTTYDPAARRARTLKRFGLTAADYARLLQAQDGKCGICRREPSRLPLHVDHNHRTREIRGLLCHRCNRGLGFFRGEDAERIREYLTMTTGWFVPKPKRRR